MLTTIKGAYRNGQIILEEKPPLTTDAEVLVTFTKVNDTKKKDRLFGSGKGSVLFMAADFNASLTDLKEYM